MEKIDKKKKNIDHLKIKSNKKYLRQLNGGKQPKKSRKNEPKKFCPQSHHQ